MYGSSRSGSQRDRGSSYDRRDGNRRHSRDRDRPPPPPHDMDRGRWDPPPMPFPDHHPRDFPPPPFPPPRHPDDFRGGPPPPFPPGPYDDRRPYPPPPPFDRPPYDDRGRPMYPDDFDRGRPGGGRPDPDFYRPRGGGPPPFGPPPFDDRFPPPPPHHLGPPPMGHRGDPYEPDMRGRDGPPFGPPPDMYDRPRPDRFPPPDMRDMKSPPPPSPSLAPGGPGGPMGQKWSHQRRHQKEAIGRNRTMLEGEYSTVPVLKPPIWEMENLLKFTKNLYTISEQTSQRTEDDIVKLRLKKGLLVFGEDVPKPCLELNEVGCLPEPILTILNNEVKTPALVHSQVWPAALSGRDVLCVGAPSPARILSYVAPAMLHINSQPRLQPGEGTVVLILCPTKEYVTAVQDVCTHYGHSIGVRNAVVFAGVPKGPQIRDVQKGVEIVIATPARLVDLMASGATTLTRVTYAIIEKADQMLELGFSDYIAQLLPCLRPDRQMFIFAREFTPYVQDLTRAWLRNPVEIHLTSDHQTLSLPQRMEKVSDDNHKRQLLSPLLDAVLDHGHTCLILTKTLVRANDLTSVLRSHGYPALVLPEGKDSQRRWVLDELVSLRSPILVGCDATVHGATSSSDLTSIEFNSVLNYDMPKTVYEYLHRLRAVTRSGGMLIEAVSFVSPSDCKVVGAIASALQSSRKHAEEQEGAAPPSGETQEPSSNEAAAKDSAASPEATPPTTAEVIPAYVVKIIQGELGRGVGHAQMNGPSEQNENGKSGKKHRRKGSKSRKGSKKDKDGGKRKEKKRKGSSSRSPRRSRSR